MLQHGAIDVAAPAPCRKKKAVPISVFVSRKLSRLFVRQRFTPLFDVPITIGEVRVETGDLVIGDDDGVVVWRRAELADLLEALGRRAGTPTGRK